MNGLAGLLVSVIRADNEKNKNLEDEVAKLRDNKATLEWELEHYEEIQKELKNKKINELIIKYQKDYVGGGFSSEMLKELAESFYSYDKREDNWRFIAIGWCNVFEDILMRRAKSMCEYERCSNQADAINIIENRKDAFPYKDTLHKVRMIRNKVAHPKGSITKENVKTLYDGLFGSKGVFNYLVKMKP
jgi:uncharacterized protein YeeX (DUF496 family)